MTTADLGPRRAPWNAAQGAPTLTEALMVSCEGPRLSAVPRLGNVPRVRASHGSRGKFRVISYASYVPRRFARSPACRARIAGGKPRRSALSRTPDRLVDLCEGGDGYRRHVGSAQGVPPHAGREGGGGITRGGAPDALPGRQREAGPAPA